ALTYPGFRKIPTESNVFYRSVFNAIFFLWKWYGYVIRPDPGRVEICFFSNGWMKLVSAEWSEG
ncbi:TPA: hypothetical protein ACP4RO_005041, partial [Escherichia coli]